MNLKVIDIDTNLVTKKLNVNPLKLHRLNAFIIDGLYIHDKDRILIKKEQEYISFYYFMKAKGGYTPTYHELIRLYEDNMIVRSNYDGGTLYKSYLFPDKIINKKSFIKMIKEKFGPVYIRNFGKPIEINKDSIRSILLNAEYGSKKWILPELTWLKDYIKKYNFKQKKIGYIQEIEGQNILRIFYVLKDNTPYEISRIDIRNEESIFYRRSAGISENWIKEEKDKIFLNNLEFHMIYLHEYKDKRIQNLFNYEIAAEASVDISIIITLSLYANCLENLIKMRYYYILNKFILNINQNFKSIIDVFLLEWGIHETEEITSAKSFSDVLRLKPKYVEMMNDSTILYANLSNIVRTKRHSLLEGLSYNKVYEIFSYEIMNSTDIGILELLCSIYGKQNIYKYSEYINSAFDCYDEELSYIHYIKLIKYLSDEDVIEKKDYTWKIQSLNELEACIDELSYIKNKHDKLILFDIITERSKKEKKYRYKSDKLGLFLKYPESVEEVHKEGRKLNHCVASFIPSIERKDTTILFLRKISAPNKPYFTVEVKNNKIRQVHGFDNCNPDDQIKTFLKQFCKAKNVKALEDNSALGVE